MKLFNREPAVILGIVAAVILAVVQTLAGEGVIGADAASTIIGLIDNTSTPLPLDGWAMPILLGLITRFAVYSPSSVATIVKQTSEATAPQVAKQIEEQTPPVTAPQDLPGGANEELAKGDTE